MHCSEFLGVLKQSLADGFLNDLYYLNLKQGPVHSKTFVPISFLSDPGVPGPIYGSSCLSLTNSLTIPCADLTDVTLTEEDNNSIPTDNVPILSYL